MEPQFFYGLTVRGGWAARGRLSPPQRQYCRRLRAGGWRHFRCSHTSPHNDEAVAMCALCGREPPTFAHAALRCGAMVAERVAVEEAVLKVAAVGL